MGACATKPKVLKTDAGDAPAPEPAPENTVVDAKLENGSSDGESTEIVDDDKTDSESRCLSHLFSDQNEGKDSNGQEKAAAGNPSEKLEIPPETEKKMNPPTEEKPSETIPLETEKKMNPPPEEKPSETITPETEKKITPPTEEKPSETNPPEPEPPVSDSAAENAEPIESNIKAEVTDENDPPPKKTESSEKPTETEEPVIKVISN